MITKAAAKAVGLDLLPLNFCDKSNGMTPFAESLIELGQSFVPSVTANVSNLLPCGKSVRAALIDLSANIQKKFNGNLPAILALCGVIICDGVKLDAKGKKYYDFVMNYIHFPMRSVAEGGV